MTFPARQARSAPGKAGAAGSPGVGTTEEQLRHMLGICRQMAHQNNMGFSVWCLEIAMHSLDEKDQRIAVPLVDRRTL